MGKMRKIQRQNENEKTAFQLCGAAGKTKTIRFLNKSNQFTIKKMSKYTATGWNLYSSHREEQYIDTPKNGEEHRPLFRIEHNDEVPDEEAEANAKLIHAAPAMFEALTELLRAYKEEQKKLTQLTGIGFSNNYVCIQAEEALLKAEGETA